MQSTSHQQTLDNTDVFGANLRSTEEPVFSSHGYDSEGSFQVIGTRLNTGVIEEHFQLDFTFPGILQCLG